MKIDYENDDDDEDEGEATTAGFGHTIHFLA